MFAVGVGRTAVDLSIIGASGCTLYTNPLIIILLTTSATGTGSVKLTAPNDPTLVGVAFHTQYAFNDAAANNAGIVFTAGAENRVGR